jgi:hypothetical protein
MLLLSRGHERAFFAIKLMADAEKTLPELSKPCHCEAPFGSQILIARI